MTKVVTGGNEFKKMFYIYEWEHVKAGELAQADEPFHTWGHDPYLFGRI